MVYIDMLVQRSFTARQHYSNRKFPLSSKTVGIWNPTILNSETFEIQTFWRLDFKWLGFSYGYSSPNHSKSDHSKSRRLCPDFKWFLTKWQSFVQISNGSASGFQIPFEIRTQPLFDHSKTRQGPVGFQIPIVDDFFNFNDTQNYPNLNWH